MIILVTNLKSSSSGGRVCFVQCGHLYLIFSTVSSLCITQSMALNDWYDVKLPGIVCMLWTSSFCNYHQFVVRKGPRDANEITAKHQQCKGLSFNPHKLQILSLSRNLAISPESSCQANCTKRIHTFLSKNPVWPNLISKCYLLVVTEGPRLTWCTLWGVALYCKQGGGG